MPPKSSKSADAAASTAEGKPKKAAASSTSSDASAVLFSLTWISALLYGVYFCVRWAYKIRLQAIEEYGPVIHEFDPWFNYRATEVCMSLCVLCMRCAVVICA